MTKKEPGVPLPRDEKVWANSDFHIYLVRQNILFLNDMVITAQERPEQLKEVLPIYFP